MEKPQHHPLLSFQDRFGYKPSSNTASVLSATQINNTSSFPPMDDITAYITKEIQKNWPDYWMIEECWIYN